MSKRTYRRLAVVAGAALAVGSMAPAMAAHIGGSGDGTVTVDLSDVALPTVPTTDSLIPSALIADASDFGFGTASGAQTLVLGQVAGLQNDATSIVGDLLGAATGSSADVNAGAHANSGGTATLQVSGIAGAGNVLGAVPSTDDVLAGAEGIADSVAGFGMSTANGALGLAGSAQGLAVSSAGGLLGTGLGLVSVPEVTADVNAVAGLMGSF